MQIQTIHTNRVEAGQINLFDFLDSAIERLNENCIVAITSKIVSLCENNVRKQSSSDKQALFIEESNLYLPETLSQFGYRFTIIQNTLVPVAGIDESNSGGYYVLWPKDCQKSANLIRKHLCAKFGLKKLGVVITDSTSQPLRRGATGIALAHSGFKALNDYVGKPDLFGRPFSVSKANVASGLAAAAVVAMGEGTEQTPICIISDAPLVQFQTRKPSSEELAELYVSLDDDLFAPFLNAVQWKKGGRN